LAAGQLCGVSRIAIGGLRTARHARYCARAQLSMRQRIGELSRELETAQFGDGPGTAPRLPAGGKTKEGNAK
jgi:hypothetical protein